MASFPIDIHLFVQALVYFAASFASLLVAVLLALTQDGFHGGCILFAKADWKNSSYAVVQYGHSASCGFVTYYHVVVGMLMALGLGGYYSFGTYKSRLDKEIARQMWVMPFVLCCALVSLLMFVAGCTLSIGFSVFCKSYTSGSDADIAKTCKGSQKQFSNQHFFHYLTVAQTACWVAFFLWTAELILIVLRYFRNRKQTNSEMYAPDVPASDQSQFANEEPTA